MEEIYIFDMGKPVKIIDLARKMTKAGFIPGQGDHDKDCGTATGRKLYKDTDNFLVT
jgi:FlaA1/EpsC-like NDP-sugar epimerase